MIFNINTKDKAKLVYLIRVHQIDKDTNKMEIKNYPIFNRLFDTKGELLDYLEKVVSDNNKCLYTYRVVLNASKEYREELKEKEKLINNINNGDFVTIDRGEVRDIIRDVIVKHGKWKDTGKETIESDIMWAMFRLIGITVEDIYKISSDN